MQTGRMNPVELSETELEKVSGGYSEDDFYYYHKVKRGDTLGKIASKYGSTVQRIMDENLFIRNPNLLQTGWTLKIPKR